MNQWDANEFVDLDAVRIYLQAFKRVAVNGGSQAIKAKK
ncbi:hypothetical protein HDG34_003192 [Paraburkholderia sp. HC6.4b]|nr:hypothetical protein [Paraburkholderia sp. HC6.4b]MBB5450979.1 hypothetical protein [Paraburkholderia sp. Kb1A]